MSSLSYASTGLGSWKGFWPALVGSSGQEVVDRQPLATPGAVSDLLAVSRARLGVIEEHQETQALPLAHQLAGDRVAA